MTSPSAVSPKSTVSSGGQVTPVSNQVCQRTQPKPMLTVNGSSTVTYFGSRQWKYCYVQQRQSVRRRSHGHRHQQCPTRMLLRWRTTPVQYRSTLLPTFQSWRKHTPAPLRIWRRLHWSERTAGRQRYKDVGQTTLGVTAAQSNPFGVCGAINNGSAAATQNSFYVNEQSQLLLKARTAPVWAQVLHTPPAPSRLTSALTRVL